MKLLKAIFAIVIVGLGAAIMISLGFWQLDRLEERKAHNAQIESQIHQPPLPITGEILDPTGLEYRPVTVTGTYDYSQEIILRNRTLNDAPGVHVLTPLKIEGSDKAVLVDRGWIPYEFSLFSKREPYQNVSGRVTVTGLLRLSQSKTAPIGPSDPFVNADMPRLDAWYWVNIPQIQQQFREYELLPFYIEQDPGPDETAIPAPTHEIDMSEGSHLSYAIQWFSFAIILVVGSIGLWWSRRGKPNKKAQV
jgi:surfeit locus 1 family protein